MGKTFSTGLLTNGVFQDSSNNIGIGAAPSGTYKLEVTGTAKVSSTLLVSGAATLTGALNGTSATFSSDVSIVNTGNALLKVFSNTTSSPIADIELMRGSNTTWGADAYTDYRIRNSGGDLSIQSGESGVTSTRLTIASTGAATFSSSVTTTDLNVFDTYANDPLIKLASTTSGNVEVQMRTATTTYNAGIGVVTSGYDFNIFTNNSTKMTITSGGNVGIGTSSPATTLNIVGGNSNVGSTTSDYGLAIQAPTSMAEGVGGSILLQGYKTGTSAIGNFAYVAGKKENGTAGNEAGYLSFGTFNSAGVPAERMRITSTGNVGIGTATPSNTLDVNGIANFQTQVYLANGTASAPSLRFNNSNCGLFLPSGVDAIGFAVSNSEKWRITSNGQLNNSNAPNGTWVQLVTNTNGTNNSYGLLIQAGTSFVDKGFEVVNSTGSTSYFKVRGDGLIFIGITNSTALAANLVLNGTELQKSTSSLKYKKNVRDYDKGLDIVKQLRPVYYNGINDGEKQFAGLIAEEIHELGLNEFVVYAEDGTPDALGYANMVALAFKAIQEQNQLITSLQDRLTKGGL